MGAFPDPCAGEEDHPTNGTPSKSSSTQTHVEAGGLEAFRPAQNDIPTNAQQQPKASTTLHLPDNKSSLLMNLIARPQFRIH
jgi:hypothetical protein